MDPFIFRTRINQIELLGKKAKNLKQLADGIKTVPAPSIYHHTHRFLEQHIYFSPEHPNDFSYWTTTSLGLKRLGEIIASVEIFQFKDIELLRKKFVTIIETYLENVSSLRNCILGEEFNFMASKMFILNTPFKAYNLKDFVDCLAQVTIHSFYFHMFEARMRLQKHENDFSRWFKDNGFERLAGQIASLDPYTHTLEGLRKKIINLIKKYIQ
ncbi:MAG: DUF5752 family protein [Candidatus Omnitrophica bacterium]|nr:DUF5752 family protein [Candidatus Omnitrophota bacterium]MCF7878174.1 DUF5752 family protein [Candidatus Omnitrophota bacterium]MCF7892606.1 DUF5752 family protein [Candidatus Omnitrophota bacterium]